MTANNPHDFRIIAYNPNSILDKIIAAWWCLSGRVVTIAISIPNEKYFEREKSKCQ